MEEARIQPTYYRKPLVVLDKSMIENILEAGEEGYLDAVLEVEGIESYMDDDGTERLRYQFSLKSSKVVDASAMRLI